MSDLPQLLDQVAICLETGQLPEAERLCLEATEAAPVEPVARHALGVVYVRQQKLTDALDCFDHVLTLKPDYVPALSNRGNVLKLLGRVRKSLVSFDRAVSLQPTYVPVLCNRASLLFELRQFKDAVSDYEAVLRIQPNHTGAMVGRGNALRQLAQLEALGGNHENSGLLVEKASDAYRQAIRLRPDSAEAHYSLGMALHQLDRLDEAIESYRHAIRLQPELAEAHSDLGVAQIEVGQAEHAIGNLNRAIALDPATPKFEWNKALYLLATGAFEEGWTLYERRLAGLKAASRAFGWLNRENLNGKSVCVWAEQGLGDTIQFCRYARLVEGRGAKVTLRVQHRLARLLSQLSPTIEVVSSAIDESRFDYNIPLLSLPFAFGTLQDPISPEIPYLKPETEKVRYWKARLGNHGYKIGVAWQGTHATKLAAARSFPLQSLAGISKRPGVRLINLQKGGDVQRDRDGSGPRVEVLGPQFDASDDGFLDTAAAMQNLDLVITSDSVIAHLAGALGRPVWVALKKVPDWRWLLSRRGSPWYPTMTLFRQKTRGDWASVFQAMEDELTARMREAEWVSGNA